MPVITAPKHGQRGGGGGKQAEKVIVFRSKKKMYEPCARQLMSAERAEEEEERVAVMTATEAHTRGAAEMMGGAGALATSPAVSERNAMSDGAERQDTLLAAAESPGIGVRFDLTQNRVRGKRNAQRQPGEMARLPFAERFGGMQQGSVGTGRLVVSSLRNPPLRAISGLIQTDCVCD